MKKTIFLTAFSFSLATVFAQKETFDLTSYTPPKDAAGTRWKKEVTENITSYTFINKKNNSWCRINIIKSTISKGSIEQDFENEWQDLVVKNYKPADAPQLNEVQEAEGWKIKAGGVKFIFNNSDAMAMLTTMSGFDRCVSIVATTNSLDYLKDIEALLSSVDLKKPEITTQLVTNNNSNNNSILGTWLANASDQSSWRVNNGVMSTISRQYTFNANGTYIFISKTFDPLMDRMFLGKENGIYQISGNNITISPKKSVLEAWSKKNGSEWDKLLNSQNISPEKVTYQFTRHFFEGNQKWNLVLQAANVTKRDGPFSGNTTFANSWYYGPISATNVAIKLPN